MATNGGTAAGTTFFFDRSVGKAVPNALRALGVETHAHDCVYRPQGRVRDETWIRELAARGHVLVTKDRAIRHRRLELAAVHSAQARLLVLADRKADRFSMLRALLVAWPEIQKTVRETPTRPWICTIPGSGKLSRVA